MDTAAYEHNKVLSKRRAKVFRFPALRQYRNHHTQLNNFIIRNH